MNKKQALDFFTLLSKSIKNPDTELIYNSDFELLIAVILSAHTTDVSVNKATSKLFKIANTPEKIIELGEKDLKKYIKGVGLYNNKATNIIKTCEILKESHNSKVPDTRLALESLPGVGRKSANVILNIVFKQPTIFVDTHVFRVSNRTGLATGKNVRIVEDKLEKIIPEKFKLIAANLLVLHGRYVCKARKPLCDKCVVNKLCAYLHK